MTLSVSAVIPMYNGERFVAEAIDSILSQTILVDEIIVIDDGSTDQGKMIVTALAVKSKIPIHIYSQSNSGVSAARNAGLLHSKSELIAFLDVDDLWEPSKIEKQLLCIEQHGANTFCFTDYYQDVREISSSKFSQSKMFTPTYEAEYESERFQHNFIIENFIGTASTIMFNRKLALSLGGFNPQLNHSEDFDFILRYSTLSKLVPVNQPLVLKRTHDANLTGDLALHFWSHWYVLHKFVHLDSNYSRFNFSDNVVKILRDSHDEYCTKFCNILFEKYRQKSFSSFVSYAFRLKTLKGFQRHMLAFLGKFVRFISKDKIKK